MSHYSSPTPLNVDIRVDAKNGKNKCTLKPPLHNCQPHHNKITKTEKFAAYIRIFIQTFFFSVSHPFSRGLNMVETPKRDIEMKPTFFRNRRSQFPKLLFYPKRFLPWESLRVLIGNFFQCSFWSFLVLLLRLRRQICRNPPWDSVFCALAASGSLLSYNGCYKWYSSSKWVAIASWIT